MRGDSLQFMFFPLGLCFSSFFLFRLRSRALKLNMYTEEPTISHESSLDTSKSRLFRSMHASLLSKHLRMWLVFKGNPQKDIIKKNTTKKNDYIFVFPGNFKSLECGSLGYLDRLDSEFPVLYLDFPQGRLKMQGILVSLKDQLVALNIRPQGENINIRIRFGEFKV